MRIFSVILRGGIIISLHCNYKSSIAQMFHGAQIFPSVSKYIMYSWALCTGPHLYLLALSTRNPHGWRAQLLFYLFSLLPPSREYPIAPTEI